MAHGRWKQGRVHLRLPRSPLPRAALPVLPASQGPVPTSSGCLGPCGGGATPGEVRAHGRMGPAHRHLRAHVPQPQPRARTPPPRSAIWARWAPQDGISVSAPWAKAQAWAALGRPLPLEQSSLGRGAHGTSRPRVHPRCPFGAGAPGQLCSLCPELVPELSEGLGCRGRHVPGAHPRLLAPRTLPSLTCPLPQARLG